MTWGTNVLIIFLDGVWYCSVQCERNHSPVNRDRMKDYATALLFHGLLDLTRKDCVRENDGPMMMTFWKWDLMSFFNRNHTKYVILAHRLLAGIIEMQSKIHVLLQIF